MNLPIDLIQFDQTPINQETLQEIQESMKEKGLFHPILVSEIFSVTEIPGSLETFEPSRTRTEKEYKLITGRKRLLAARNLGWTEIPVIIRETPKTEDEAKELQLHENLKRGNLPWYDEIEARKELHELRQRIHGKPVKGLPRLVNKNNGWSIQDTAKELGISIGALSQDLDLALAVSQNPSLKKVKDKTTALKLVKQTAKRMEAEAFALIPPDFEMNQVFLGDSSEILRNIPDQTFNACITDPPWSTYSRGEGEDATLVIEQEKLIPIFKEVYRVLKNDSFLYLITSSVDFIFYQRELPKLGFSVQQYPLIWQKTRTITHGRKNWEYARDYEPILLAVKGSPILNSPVEISSILSYPNLHYTKMNHPNEKPIELLNQIIKDCSFEGSSILDPFSGSGVTLESAKRLRRNFIGIEENRKFYDQIVRRLEELK